MYDHISGELVRKDLTEVVLRSGGIGYSLIVPVSTFEALPASGNAVLFTHLIVREDELRLYGFATPRERVFFRILMTAAGIGPAVALAVMSGATMEAFSRAVVDEDYDALSRVRGIGKKTARRIVAELKDAVADFRRQYLTEEAPADAAARDAVLALVSLGYPRGAAEKQVEKLRARHPSAHVDQLVRLALADSS